MRPPTATPSREHDQRLCRICKHPRREEIEADFVTWRSAKAIAREFKLGNGYPTGLYRHARALGLFEERGRNLRAALGLIIERAGKVRPATAAVVAAVEAYARINAEGCWTQPLDAIHLVDLFDCMTAEELEAYRRDGVLPRWFQKAVFGPELEEERKPAHPVKPKNVC